MAAQITVLVVEDEPLIRFDLVQTLEAAGFNTVEAADAARAIHILEARSDIQVVFTDIQMPGAMDGLALAKYVRDRWPPTIIVVSSGRQRPSSYEMAERSIFLEKPFTPGRLTAILQSIHQQLN